MSGMLCILSILSLVVMRWDSRAGRLHAVCGSNPASVTLCMTLKMAAGSSTSHPLDAATPSTENWTGSEASIQHRGFIVPTWWQKNQSIHQLSTPITGRRVSTHIVAEQSKQDRAGLLVQRSKELAQLPAEGPTQVNQATLRVCVNQNLLLLMQLIFRIS